MSKAQALRKLLESTWHGGEAFDRAYALAESCGATEAEIQEAIQEGDDEYEAMLDNQAFAHEMHED